MLNCELPLSSRWHAIQAFNRGAFDLLIATDDPKLMTGRATESKSAGGEEGAAEEEDDGSKKAKKQKKKGSKGDATTMADAEFGVSRGVDFTDVTAVLNMDLPTSLAVYRHRIGRTARGGKGGTSISLVSPEAADENLLAEMHEAYTSTQLHQFQVDMTKLAAFRYRTEDALRAVTKTAVKEARLREIKRELLHSKKLQSHFEDNPDDLTMLRHDKPTSSLQQRRPHLQLVPSYLKPDTEGTTQDVAPVGSSSRRLKQRGGKKRTLFGGVNKGGRKKDPLRGFRGGGKKRTH